MHSTSARCGLRDQSEPVVPTPLPIGAGSELSSARGLRTELRICASVLTAQLCAEFGSLQLPSGFEAQLLGPEIRVAPRFKQRIQRFNAMDSSLMHLCARDATTELVEVTAAV